MPLFKLQDVEEKFLFEGYKGQIMHGDKITVAHVRVKANSPLPEHSHPHEQVMNLIEGEFLFTVDGVEHHMRAGESFVIPSNTPHSAKSVTDCYIVDVFTPTRDDWK